MKTELWKELRTINPNYEISNQGRLRKKVGDDYKILLGFETQSHGNYHAHKIDGRKYYTHRLVMLAFIGECPDGHEVDHISRNTLDNRLQNLRYLPRYENRSASSKLTTEQVKAILYLQSVEGVTKKKVAELFDVCYHTIHRITSGKTYSNVKR